MRTSWARSVMGVIRSHLPDYSSLRCGLNWGKRNACLEFRKPEDQETVRSLYTRRGYHCSGISPRHP
ncbi:hypothetical protein I7I50_08845 [Histoplasma capsulatum G186AR]|uniref:Uncharacterized protein n=1 Tax=Ajellomyces capsulatus TaxID=5037 RepID=A0A8H7YRF9_AJECA|nr:hypothetical protein I7I52_06359 [Histoplasma capsulatum]QSS73909.1 hypothetical protein I7I50_08845 [Histoplasma capsulatum G186AR]